jgi:quinol-cytochrome oxidoreductase complex cytochrome b subunit
VLPGGSDLLFWVWGGYSVGPATLKFFFTLHYLLPWVILVVVLLHLVLLHGVGRTSPLFYRGSLTKGWFHPYYLSKDGLSLVALFVFYFLIFVLPYSLGDPEIFIEANSLVSPLHIVPEWYFLFAYAMLRAQPVKVAGVLLLVGRLVIPSLLCLVSSLGSPLSCFLRLLS